VSCRAIDAGKNSAIPQQPLVSRLQMARLYLIHILLDEIFPVCQAFCRQTQVLFQKLAASFHGEIAASPQNHVDICIRPSSQSNGPEHSMVLTA